MTHKEVQPLVAREVAYDLFEDRHLCAVDAHAHDGPAALMSCKQGEDLLPSITTTRKLPARLEYEAQVRWRHCSGGRLAHYQLQCVKDCLRLVESRDSLEGDEVDVGGEVRAGHGLA